MPFDPKKCPMTPCLVVQSTKRLSLKINLVDLIKNKQCQERQCKREREREKKRKKEKIKKKLKKVKK